MTADLKVNIN